MTEIWVWKVWQEFEPGTSVTTDLSGYSVEATDGHIGNVDEASFEEQSGSLIVDTGFWIFGKKRLVPAGMIERIDPDERVLYLSCTKDDVKAAPDYDEARASDAEHRREVGDHYDATSRSTHSF